MKTGKCHNYNFQEVLSLFAIFEKIGNFEGAAKFLAKMTLFLKLAVMTFLMAFIKKIKSHLCHFVAFFNFWDRFFLQLFSIWS